MNPAKGWRLCETIKEREGQRKQERNTEKTSQAEKNKADGLDAKEGWCFPKKADVPKRISKDEGGREGLNGTSLKSGTLGVS